MKLKLFTDGGARGNPGPAAIGIVVYKGDEIVKKYAARIGHATNNQAEYMAILKGLTVASKIDNSELVCYLDSELVVKQLNGEYKVKDQKLKPLHAKVIKEAESFLFVSFKHIPRHKNTIADELVNRALDGEI